MKVNWPGGRNIKNKEKFHQNSATVKQPKDESGLSKQLISNFQTENSCELEQLEAWVKNGVAYKKCVYLECSLKWVQVLKRESLVFIRL